MPRDGRFQKQHPVYLHGGRKRDLLPTTFVSQTRGVRVRASALRGCHASRQTLCTPSGHGFGVLQKTHAPTRNRRKRVPVCALHTERRWRRNVRVRYSRHRRRMVLSQASSEQPFVRATIQSEIDTIISRSNQIRSKSAARVVIRSIHLKQHSIQHKRTTNE